MIVGDVYDGGPVLPKMAEVGRRNTGFSRFALPYQIAIAALTMQVRRFKQESTPRDGVCPIVAVSARIKTHDSIVTKARRLCCPLTADDIRTNILDVAGLCITCSRISDTYLTAVWLCELSGVTLIEVEDYNAKPKPNGYTSLHLVIEVPVRLSNRTQSVPVEVRIKALAKDLQTKREHTRQKHIMLWATLNAEDGDRNSPPGIDLDARAPRRTAAMTRPVTTPTTQTTGKAEARVRPSSTQSCSAYAKLASSIPRLQPTFSR